MMRIWYARNQALRPAASVRSLFPIMLALGIVQSGCGAGSSAPSGAGANQVVKGKVLLGNGKPLTRGRVVLTPKQEPMLPLYGELEPDGSLQIMYGIDGRHDLPEEELPHLQGYLGSRPLRIGNSAVKHLQLDIYGELLDAIYLYDKYGSPISYDLWRNVRRLVDWVCVNWRRPDANLSLTGQENLAIIPLLY